MWNLQRDDTNELTKQNQTHRLGDLMVAGGEGRGKGYLGMDTYTLLYLKRITNKDLLSSTRNSAPCYVAAWMGGEFVGEWIHTYVWLSPFTVHLKLSHHC